MKYNLFEKVVRDIKTRQALNLESEKFKIDEQLFELLNNIDIKQAAPTTRFFECLRLSTAYLKDIPNFFEKSLKNFILNDKFSSQEQLLNIISAQNLYFEQFEGKQREKLIGQIQSKFNY